MKSMITLLFLLALTLVAGVALASGAPVPTGVGSAGYGALVVVLLLLAAIAFFVIRRRRSSRPIVRPGSAGGAGGGSSYDPPTNVQ